MGEAIGQLLPFAVGVAISPVPIIAVVLMLVTPRARTNGPAFLLGTIAGIAITGTIVLAVAGPAYASDQGGPATWVNWLMLVLGLLLLLAAVRQWRGRPPAGEDAPMPKWMNALDDFTAVKSAGTAVLLSGLNPKNLLLIIGGAAAIAETGISTGEEALAWVVFTLIASLGVGTPVVIHFALGDRAPALLEKIRDWMAGNSVAIMAVLFVIIGAKLIGDAITGFTA